MKNKSISQKLNIILLLVVLVVLSISGLISYKINKEKIHNQMLYKLSRIEKRLQLILPDIIWNLQMNVVQNIIKVESLDDLIDTIIIKDFDGKEIASIIKTTKDLTKYGIHKQKTHIKYNNEIIATVLIYHNHMKLKNLQKQTLVNLILQALIILFFLQLLFSFFINKYIISNILKLQKGISLFSNKKNFEQDIIIDTRDEIYLLAIEFNDMKNNLKKSWEQLKQLNKNLENKVKYEVELNKKAQLQLYRSEKMASMGEMIGNIAHQWRQPLSLISTSATALILKNDYKILKEEDIVNYCNIINDNSQYLSKTIDDFKNFIKGDKEIELINIKELIDKFLNLSKPSIQKENINIILNIDEDLSFYSYPNELLQCFINIFNNARDALVPLPKDERTILINANIVHEQITITFQDNAGGIPEDIIAKIFEPYFTTKHKSKGTGLGLNMAYNLIIEGMDGRIIAQNKKLLLNDKNYMGALFSIYLPSLKKPTSDK